MTRVMALWQARPFLTTAFLLACGVTVFFAVRLALSAIYWAGHHEMPVEPWMTVGYIARSWDVDPRELDRLAGLPLPEVKGRPQPISEIAADRGVPVAQIMSEVEAALATLRAQEAQRRTGSGE